MRSVLLYIFLLGFAFSLEGLKASHQRLRQGGVVSDGIDVRGIMQPTSGFVHDLFDRVRFLDERAAGIPLRIQPDTRLRRGS
jgi:hypothetical protein